MKELAELKALPVFQFLHLTRYLPSEGVAEIEESDGIEETEEIKGIVYSFKSFRSLTSFDFVISFMVEGIQGISRIAGFVHYFNSVNSLNWFESDGIE